jgi:hypothetical protein
LSEEIIVNTEIYSAINLAYQWEHAANRVAFEGLAYPQALPPLEPIRSQSKHNLQLLEWKLSEFDLPQPLPLELGWLEVMVQLTTAHPGVRALAEAAKIDPSLEPLLKQLRFSSAIYGDCALQILASLEPKRHCEPAIRQITPLKFDESEFDQAPPFSRDHDTQKASLFELMIKGFSLPTQSNPR